jgi:hypothetical protein
MEIVLEVTDPALSLSGAGRLKHWAKTIDKH